MIIYLYESNYPIVQNEVPKWEELPIGCFECDWRKLRGIEDNKRVILYGTFIYAGRKDTFRPRSGEHLLAVLVYKGDRYIYNATISYTTMDLGRKQKWWARLGLGHQIQKW